MTKRVRATCEAMGHLVETSIEFDTGEMDVPERFAVPGICPHCASSLSLKPGHYEADEHDVLHWVRPLELDG